MKENSQDSVALQSSLELLFCMIKQFPGNFGINTSSFPLIFTAFL